tara:strand:- start:215198 stop:217831 length:2634 start_codon:yes stop_codon:yes gene_type:complete
VSKKQSISPPPKPPRWATRFLEWYCRPSLYEDLQGDLLEYFERNVAAKGLTYARFIYIIDVIKFFRLYTVQKPQILKRMNQFYIFGNYVKTSVRSMARNRLFTTINVVGLAVSMSVGLLIIAFVSDLLSYDSFHENKDRTYRLIAKDVHANGHTMELATTSMKAAQRIREEMPEVESLTVFRRGFGGDAKIGDKTIPVGGFWADDSFFETFSFNLLKGDPQTALRELHSVVLTETTANKLFGSTDVVGKTMQFDTTTYVVTGLMADIPKLSHLRFEALGSLSTIAVNKADSDGDLLAWDNIYMSHIYMIIREGSNLAAIHEKLDQISQSENAALKNREISLFLQPMDEIAVGHHYSNEAGLTMNIIALWILIGLGAVVIISACFNYTNLSIARALRRSKEVGIRKVIGASRGHVIGQFLTESVLVSLLAVAFAFVLFLIIRGQFLSVHTFISNIVSLNLTVETVLYFVGFAVATGLVAGFLPAVFFSRIRSLQVVKGASPILTARRGGLRKGLIVVQYVFSLVFITATFIGYVQYKGLLAFNLGFNTENILNIRLQGNKADLLKKEIIQLPEVDSISQSLIVTSLGSIYGTKLKYQGDSLDVWQNLIDENYLPLHGHTLLAGRNFEAKAGTAEETEVIVNEQLLKELGKADEGLAGAIGEVVVADNKRLTVIGVVKDFHYETLEDPIHATILRYSKYPSGYLNVKISPSDWPATRAALEGIWEEVDPVHPLDAKFYDQQIEDAYGQFAVMIKVIGFLAFLAVCIASMGLFGMVVFTTETKLKEISIRKVLGAGERSLVYQLGKGFLVLLAVAALIALPVTYIFFDKVVLANFAFHEPIGMLELFAGLFGVLIVAVLMIGSQTLRAARTNPVNVLRNE